MLAAAAVLSWDLSAIDKRYRGQPTPEKTAGPAARHGRHDRSVSFFYEALSFNWKINDINAMELSRLIVVISKLI